MSLLKTFIIIFGLLLTSKFVYAQEKKAEPTLDETVQWIADNIEGFTVSAENGNEVLSTSARSVAINSCNLVLQQVRRFVRNYVGEGGGDMVTETQREYRIPLGRLKPPKTSAEEWDYQPWAGKAPVVFLSAETQAIRVRVTYVVGGSDRRVTPSTSTTDESTGSVGLFSKDEDLVNRMQKAFSRAIALCKAKEPF